VDVDGGGGAVAVAEEGRDGERTEAAGSVEGMSDRRESLPGDAIWHVDWLSAGFEGLKVSIDTRDLGVTGQQ